MRNRVEGKDGGGVAAQRTAQRTGSTEPPVMLRARMGVELVMGRTRPEDTKSVRV